MSTSPGAPGTRASSTSTSTRRREPSTRLSASKSESTARGDVCLVLYSSLRFLLGAFFGVSHDSYECVHFYNAKALIKSTTDCNDSHSHSGIQATAKSILSISFIRPLATPAAIIGIRDHDDVYS